MQIRSGGHRAFALAAGIALLALSGWAVADPPSRVARLGYLNGAVSFSPAGEDDWVQGTLNRPLTTGDRLWSDGTGRAEIQVGGAVVRMGANTGVSVLNLDNQTVQLQLTQGTLNVRVRRLEPNQVFEVDTPNLAFTLRQPGEYRIEVDPDGSATTIIVRKGQGEAYGDGAAYVVDARQPYRFTGTGLRGYQDVDAPRFDEFDRWSSDRDRAFDRSPSARYVSPDVVGYQDLDANGTWRTDPTYGNVWMPSRVAAGWAPYRDGHWAWVDPWGWTWVDDAPWGYAVSHYGRWANMNGSWGWVPGPVRTPAYYAPALVAFVGGSNFQLTISSGSVGGVGWFPLAPREVYRPSYPVSRGYFENINRSNTVVNNTIINNTYNTYTNVTNVTNVTYANRQVPGAVVAVPATVFMRSLPVSRAVVRVPPAMLAGAPVVVAAPVTPTAQSVHGNGRTDKSPGHGFERPVVAHTAPPPAPAGFAVQQRQLAARPGHPLDDAARKDLKPAEAVRSPVVKVAAPTPLVPPTALPPRGAAGGRPDSASDRAVPPALPPVASPAMRPPEPRRRSDESVNGEQRRQPARPPPVPPAPAAKPVDRLPPAAVAKPQPSPSPAEPLKTAPAAKSEPRGQASKPPSGKPDDRKSDNVDAKRDEDGRKQKGKSVPAAQGG